ncbi:hypothetical protein NLI96_g1742 [Meripilus lineatus]|uniref:GST N-terminal domain-containing protein n=1 Tax=Meripilus lineatus TaxID=2056292 RepID=A0AAD5YH72_9APHY|nr:hypothetical protein NLI96_g1742 [Physisporinus lineatus]
MSDPIILYDIPGRDANFKAWSPNTWNARYALNFKGLTYKTEWVEFPNIEATAKKIGATPTAKKPDGTDYYTLPIIYDPSTKTFVSDSLPIAQYLDKTYPNLPLLFPPNTSALTAPFTTAVASNVSRSFFAIVVLNTWKVLNDESRDYFRRTREVLFGKKLEEVAPLGNAVDQWKAAEKGFDTLNTWLSTAGGSNFFAGDQIGYADIVVASHLIWARIVLGKDSNEWKTITEWNDGRWAKYLKSFENYETVV